MKGIILHGGYGTRLRPLTYTDVKQLLPLAGKPVSEYALMNLMELGIKDVNIVLGEVGADEVKNYYGNGEKWGVDITYTYQGRPLGIAHAIGLVRDFVGNEDFVVVLGDNYFQNGFLQSRDAFLSGDNDAFIVVTEVSNPKQFGIAEISDGKIVNIVEKPKDPKSNLAVTGVYFLKKSIFHFIDSLTPSWRGELEITEAFQKMIESGKKIGYIKINGWWKDTGTPEEFLNCNMMALEKICPNSDAKEERQQFWRSRLEENVMVDKESKIIGPSFIGSGTMIINSYIGPYTSIGRNCNIKNSHIENSVIMDNVSLNLDNSTIVAESLIGPFTRIESNNKNRKISKFIVGRDSNIEV